MLICCSRNIDYYQCFATVCQHWVCDWDCNSLPWLCSLWSVDADEQASQDIWKWIISMQW